jgi:nucleotide-binding universal stress UspA family protein
VAGAFASHRGGVASLWPAAGNAKDVFLHAERPGSQVALFPPGKGEARGGRDMARETILVPLDGSGLAETALETAITMLSEKPATTLLLLRAAESVPSSAFDAMVDKAYAVREAQRYLNGVAARLREFGIDRVRTSVWYGPAAPTIVEAAEVEKADLIVMTSHGCGGASRLIFGSVAESVLYGTRTPILLVRDVASPVLPPLGATAVSSMCEASVPVSRS